MAQKVRKSLSNNNNEKEYKKFGKNKIWPVLRKEVSFNSVLPQDFTWLFKQK